MISDTARLSLSTANSPSAPTRPTWSGDSTQALLPVMRFLARCSLPPTPNWVQVCHSRRNK
jgi:hypothetical protein